MLHYPDVSIEDQRKELTFLSSHLDLVWNMALILGPMIFPLIMLLVQEDLGFSCRFTHPFYQYISQHANKMNTHTNTSVLWCWWHTISIEILLFKASILPLRLLHIFLPLKLSNGLQLPLMYRILQYRFSFSI